MNEVGDDNSLILYKVRVNDQPATALFDTGASMNIISTRFINSLWHKPKILQCNRTLRGGEVLIPKCECFLQKEKGIQMFRDRVVIINNLNCNYFMGAAIQRSYHVTTGFSITGRHFLSVNGQMVAPIIKNKGKIKLNPHSITVVSVEMPPNVNTGQIYKLNHKFPLPSSTIPIDVVHKFDNKVPYKLKIPILNTTNNNNANIARNTVLVSLSPAEKVDSIFSLEWDTLLQTRQLAVEEVLDQQKTPEQVHDLLPQIPQTNLQLEADKPKQPEISTPNVEVPKKALIKLQHLIKAKYSTIVSTSATDIGRTNLIELDIPTEGPPIACKPYSVPQKY